MLKFNPKQIPLTCNMDLIFSMNKLMDTNINTIAITNALYSNSIPGKKVSYIIIDLFYVQLYIIIYKICSYICIIFSGITKSIIYFYL